MSKPSAPATPDYAGAAERTAAGNRVNQYTPYGSLTYAEGPKDSQGYQTWNQNVNLSPVGQQLLDAQNSTSLGLAGLQGQGLEAVRGMFGNMPSADQLTPSPINPGQTAQDAILSRTMPQLERMHDRNNNQLANQGIQLGSEAYTNAQRDMGQQENDAIQQAALQGINVGQQARQQGMNEQGFYSQMPINLLNAVRTGSQVQNPQFGATQGGPNYLGAAQMQGQGDLNQYNAQMGGANSMTAGLFGLGAAATPYLAKAFLPSDRRLKSDIVRIGTHPLGIGIYEYTIFGGRQIGVMAQELHEVMPDAVVQHPAGFLMVDYGKL